MLNKLILIAKWQHALSAVRIETYYYIKTLIALQQNKLDKHFEHLAQSQTVQSRAKWAKLGEKNVIYILNIEKRHATKKAVLKLRSANGTDTD